MNAIPLNAIPLIQYINSFIDPVVSKTSNGRTMLLSKLSKCAICGSKKSRFIKKQEAKGLLSSLGLKTPLRKMSVLGDILF